jgi:single-stranded-DNA-specific exonuclease
MQPLRKRWDVSPRIPSEVDQNLSLYSPVLRQLLFNRGISTKENAQAYLEAQPPAENDPRNLLGIEPTLDRVHHAVKAGETIVVYGDYDADGVTATAVLTDALRRIGAKVRSHIPNRFDEGYGVNKKALEALKEEGARVVITVDCGIRSLEEAEFAKGINLDLIITDHHHPAADLPDAFTIINPKQPGDAYVEKELAGVGIAYKLVTAIAQSQNGFGERFDPEEYLDLVALGTVADLVPLLGENRSLVRNGLSRINQPQRQGLTSLIHASGLMPGKINSENIGFTLGPRLNAAGRLDTALAALELLLATDVATSAQLAQKLDNQNRERQQLTQQIQENARAQVEEHREAFLIFAVDPEYNPGVVGLAASRLMEEFYRPAIVAFQGSEFTRGSCRSIPEFHITQALDECADLLEHHGGHAAAAGFTVRNDNLPELIDRLQGLAHEQLGKLDLRPTTQIDIEIELKDLKPGILDDLELLQPTGRGNPSALFVSRGLKIRSARTVGQDQAHLKMTVTDGVITYDAIAFRQGHLKDILPPRIDLVYSFEWDEYKRNLNRQDSFYSAPPFQLKVRDIRPTGSQD